MGRWQELEPGLRMRVEKDGNVTFERREEIGASIEAHKEMRKATAGNIAKHTEAKETGLRFVGSMPENVANDMYAKCGNDPDKHRAFIRDHKELILGIPANSANLPKKRITIYPKKGRIGK